jgi:hypothetical protein
MVKTYAFRFWFALYKDNLGENPKSKFLKKFYETPQGKISKDRLIRKLALNILGKSHLYRQKPQ